MLQSASPIKPEKLSYWAELLPEERWARLYDQWREIVSLLDGEIKGVASALPKLELGASRTEKKAYEDKLDAVICAAVAICALKGRAEPFGDHLSAIWIPILTR